MGQLTNRAKGNAPGGVTWWARLGWCCAVLIAAAAASLPAARSADGQPLPPPSRANTLQVLLESAPQTLQPARATDAYGVRISHQLLYDTLLRLGSDLKLQAGLAKSWQRVAERLLRIELRAGLRFHDGQALQANAVRDSLRYLMAEAHASPYGAVLREKIARIDVVAPLVLELHLKGPFAGIFHDLIVPVFAVSSEDAPTPDATVPPNDASLPLGSGPFMLVTQHPTEILLKRFADYHLGPAGVTYLRFKIVKDASTRVLKLRKAELDLAINALPLDKLKLFQRGKLAREYRLVTAPGLSYQYLGFNLEDAILGKLAVRRAIAHAIDVDALIRHRQHGYAQRATSVLPPSSPAAAQDISPPQYDPTLAAKLLDQAGYPQTDQQPRFTLAYKTTTDHAALLQARIMQSALAQVGIALDIRSLDWGIFYDDIRKGAFQLFSLRWVGVSEPGFLYELFHSSRIPPKGRNRVRYKNTTVDRLLAQARITTNPNTREKLYQKVQHTLAQELPYLSLWHNQNTALISQRVRHFKLHPSGGFETLPQVRLH